MKNENETTSIGLRMAKANDQEMSAAYELASVLDDLGRGYYPAREGDEDPPTFFEIDNETHTKVPGGAHLRDLTAWQPLPRGRGAGGLARPGQRGGGSRRRLHFVASTLQKRTGRV